MNIVIKRTLGIPHEIPKISDEMVRQEFIKEMGHAFVSWKWINPLVKWLNGRKVLEVMSGRGAIAYALREKDVDVIATDDFSWHSQDIPQWSENQWTHIEKMDAIEAVEKYGKDSPILLMSWAPYNEPIAYDVLKKYAEVNPKGILISIDERIGGMIADFNFFCATEEIHDESFEQVENNYESWRGCYDSPKLYKYKGIK